MSPQPSDNSHYVRRVVLPSGRAIEVVYFENANAPAEPAGPLVPEPGVEELHVCPECTQHLEYPVEWDEHDETRWEVALRCPNCEWSAVGVYKQETSVGFDDEVARGTEARVRDLKRLTRGTMEDEVQRLSRALAADAIVPEDF